MVFRWSLGLTCVALLTLGWASLLPAEDSRGGINFGRGTVKTFLGGKKGAEEAQHRDKEKMQGTWKVTFAAVGDKTIPDKARREFRVIIEGHKLTLIQGKDQEIVHFSLRPEAAPKVIEFRQKEGDAKVHWHGIYEISGGRVQLCWGPAEQKRPKDFSGNRTNQQRYYILEKAK
jgi:uncharacterized protein (TIGR03067 family)